MHCLIHKKKPSLIKCKLYICTLCARPLKFQEQSFKDNNFFHVFQTEVSRTIASDSVKYSGLFISQHYCFEPRRTTFSLWTNQGVWEYLYPCAVVLFAKRDCIACCDCCIVCWILVYLVNKHSRVSFNNKQFNLSLTFFFHFFWNSKTREPMSIC